jgi:thiol-disulfide isomerase/thioredoxin
MNRTSSLLLVPLAAGLLLGACSSTVAAPAAAPAPATVASKDNASAPMTSSPARPASATAATSGVPTTTKGMYLSYADWEAKKDGFGDSAVVLFFHAPWCPDCRATDTSLTSDGVPAGLVVVKVDYDTAAALKKKYGITQQHTFVRIDPMGTELAKWSGSKTGEAIKAKAKG